MSAAHEHITGQRGVPDAALRRAWRHGRPMISTEALIALASLFFTLAGNALFWHSALAAHPGSLRYAVSLFLLLSGAHALLLGLLVWRWNARAVAGLLTVVTALAAYYMARYHIYLDADMLRNVLATDRRESGELLTASLLWPLLTLGVLPQVPLWRMRLQRYGVVRALARRVLFLLLAAATALAGALLSFQDVSALMRNQREVRYLATPANVLLGLPRALRSENPVQHAPKRPIGLDARATPRAADSRPRLLVIVLGETARAQDWGLNGGPRQTTPQLAQTSAINFPDMHSCGTSTEVSVPCMFSPWGRHAYDETKIRAHQSLLHVLDRAGIQPLWRDNQSGCKGVCEGLPTQSLADEHTPGLCADGRCLDEILLQDLAAQVRAWPGDRVVVLHQLGNHGPAYFERYPARFRHFTPTCDTPDLGLCTRTQIRNSYDNALLYTDHLLARTIGTLQGMQDYDTAMIYLSDHGESLGEKGLFLHGMPYAIAPEEQTHVPMVMWFSAGFAQDRGLDVACLRRRAGRPTDHDALFPSVLGLLQVRTALHDRQRDLFAGCTV